jgi:Fe-S cluster assembly scaffold protein SufB
MYPTTYCIGKNSKASYHTLLYGIGESYLDVGSKVELRGEKACADITTRAVAKDRAQILARGCLVGANKDARGHLECRGLLLSEKAKIHAIPELKGIAKGCELSHEAAVGKIKEEELWYLMSRGLTEEEATSMMIKGFLNPEIVGLSPTLKEQIRKIVDFAVKEF